MKQALREVLQEEGIKDVIREVILENQTSFMPSSSSTLLSEKKVNRVAQQFLSSLGNNNDTSTEQQPKKKTKLENVEALSKKLGIPSYLLETVNVSRVPTAVYDTEGNTELEESVDGDSGFGLDVIAAIMKKNK